MNRIQCKKTPSWLIIQKDKCIMDPIFSIYQCFYYQKPEILQKWYFLSQLQRTIWKQYLYIEERYLKVLKLLYCWRFKSLCQFGSFKGGFLYGWTLKWVYFLNRIRKNCIYFGELRKTGILSYTEILILYFEGRNTTKFHYCWNSGLTLCQGVI